MIKKLAGIALLSGISFLAMSQDKVEKKVKGRPDLPGTFVLEFGFNRDKGAPQDFDLGFWGSRTVNIYYQYEFRILKSSFSFVPGIGLSLERFKFGNEAVLGYNNNGTPAMIPSSSSGIPGIKKSMLVTNYVDIPVELRYTLNPDDPSRSFKIAFGGRIGYMYDSFNKVKYSENAETKKLKSKQDFNLNQIRYGLSGRLGIGNFSLFGYYNLSPLFESNKGLQENNEYVNFNTYTIGISLASF